MRICADKLLRMHVSFSVRTEESVITHLARRTAALLAWFAVLAGVLAVASPASAATDTPRPGMSLAQIRASGINVVDLSDPGNTSIAESEKSKFPKKVYRDGSWDPQPRALEPLIAYSDFIVCDFPGSQVWTVIINPNDTQAPVDFVVESATGVGGFHARQYVSPGWNVLLTFHYPGAYRLTVGWYSQELIFGQNELVLTCP